MKTLSIVASFIVATVIALLSIFAVHNNKSFAYKVNYNALAPDVRKQVDCLAENIYFESRGEPKLGQVAVAFVTLNRAYSDLFPGEICQVVKQKENRVCQFSWYCEEKPKAMSVSKVLTQSYNPLYNDVRDLAVYVYVNYEKLEDPTKGALFFHANYVNPGWKGLEKTATIGNHIFYARR